MRHLLRFLVAYCTLSVGVLPMAHAQKKGAPVGTEESPDHYYALASGDWDSNIWGVSKSGSGRQPNELSVTKGARPPKDAGTSIGGHKLNVTVSSPVQVRSFTQRGRSTTHFAKGSNFVVDSFEGQRGNGYSGAFFLYDGGRVEATGFRLSGRTLLDDGTGSFTQLGGELVIHGGLCLTDTRPSSASANATGVFNLKGGTLSIFAREGRSDIPAIINGVGKGFFNFDGGVLRADTLGASLENKGGALAPGGEGEIGKVALVPKLKNAVVYTQRKDAALAVDIAGLSKYDQLVWKNAANNASVVLDDGAQIRVSLVKNFRPSAGAEFEVVQANSLNVGGPLKITGPDGKDFSYKVTPSPKAAIRLVYTPNRGGGELAP